MAVIFFFSSQSKGSLPSLSDDALDWAVKKTAHMVEFGILAALTWRAVSAACHPEAGLSPWCGWGTLAVVVVWAASDEYHQSFVSGRGPTIRDVLIDCVGMLLGMVLITFLLAERRRRPAWFRRRPLLDRFLDGFRPLRLAAQNDPPE